MYTKEESELLKLYEEQYIGRLFEKAVSYLNERNVLFDERDELNKEIERLNNEIKTLLKENGNKEKVIIKQNNIINELEKWITFSDTESYNPKLYYDDVCKCEYIYTDDLLDKLRELKGKDNE